MQKAAGTSRQLLLVFFLQYVILVTYDFIRGDFVDYNTLLDMSVELGYRLAMSGAETFRVEESISRVLQSYGIQAEVFAIPNCLHVSIETEEGKPMTRMRRIGHHGNNLDAVEKYNNISRKICSEHPEPDVAAQWIKDTTSAVKEYSLAYILFGNFLIGSSFTILFGGGFRDSLCAGICGLVVGVVNKFMDRMKVNPFFGIITSSFMMAIVAYFAGFLGLINSVDMTIIGTLMLLVPGLLFTNALRDIIYGDTNSGTNRIVQVFLIAAAIALGTGIALKLASSLWVLPSPAPAQSNRLVLELFAAFIGSFGFTIIFNIRGPGMFICAAGGIVTWLTYRGVQAIGGEVPAYFVATMAATLYAETFARIRKYPAISYLVISLIPVIPGAGVYYTMNYIVHGDMQLAVNKGFATIAYAGAIAVGILLVSTVYRLFITHRMQK